MWFTLGSRIMLTGAFGVTTWTRINWATLGLALRHGHGKYNGISLNTILLPPSFTITIKWNSYQNTNSFKTRHQLILPDPPLKMVSGLLIKNRWPRGHSYSHPTKIFNINTWPSESSFGTGVGFRRCRALSRVRAQEAACSSRTCTSQGSKKFAPDKNPLWACSGTLCKKKISNQKCL